MTFKEREKQLCDECHKYFKQQNRECSFRSRKLEDKCSYLQDIMYGWELGQQDLIEEIEQELLRRFLNDYNNGLDDDEVAKGCLASVLFYIRELKQK